MRTSSVDEASSHAVKERKDCRGNRLTLSSMIVLGALAVLSLDFWFAPALIDLIESMTGKFATVEVVVRIHFLIVFSQLIAVYVALLFIYPLSDFKKRLLLYFLLAEALLLCSIWIFDPPDHYFWSEESALTFFSAVVLILCAVAALVNAFSLHIQTRSSRMTKIFWFLLMTAFFYAGLDEFFMIHERIHHLFLSRFSWAGDMETGSYGLGALVFVAVFYRTLKNDLFRKGTYFFKLLLAGIFCFMLSSVVDSFDFLVADFIDRYILYYSPLNSIEEALEFTAATLFLCALVMNLFEINDHRLLDAAAARGWKHESGPVIKRFFWGFAAGMLAISVVVAAAYQMENSPILAEKGYRASIFADISDGLNRPDGLLYSPNPGLLLANGNEASNILVFDRKGNGRVFTDARSGLISPEGMSVWENSLFVADDSGKDVLKYDESGKVTAVIAGKRFRSPDGVAVDSRGDLYIADQKLALIFRMAGDRREVMASSLDGLKAPNEMVFDDQGNLYVTDEEAPAVFKITPAGVVTTLADRSQGLEVPKGITFHKGRIYVTDNQAGIIYRFNPDGSGGKFLTFARKYRGLSGIAFDDRDTLYVVSADPNSIRGYIFRIESDQKNPGS